MPELLELMLANVLSIQAPAVVGLIPLLELSVLTELPPIFTLIVGCVVAAAVL